MVRHQGGADNLAIPLDDTAARKPWVLDADGQCEQAQAHGFQRLGEAAVAGDGGGLDFELFRGIQADGELAIHDLETRAQGGVAFDQYAHAGFRQARVDPDQRNDDAQPLVRQLRLCVAHPPPPHRLDRRRAGLGARLGLEGASGDRRLGAQIGQDLGAAFAQGGPLGWGQGLGRADLNDGAVLLGQQNPPA